MKTAWIFPGDLARAVYTAGALYALSNMNIRKPDMIIAASGSAPTSICYITGQYNIITKVWLEYLSTKKFVNFLRFWKIVSADYLVDDVLKIKSVRYGKGKKFKYYCFLSVNRFKNWRN